ncbi:MAG TPA: hypothetical protein PKE29_10060 [Phycisphaerales bacterium]|nr:hypothetical protein [Phycisphaerales bacterium]
MRNTVLLRVDLTGDFKPLSEGTLVATFALLASEKNTQDVLVSDGKGAEIDLAAGREFRFERVDLSELQVKSKAGEVVFVVGHTAG